MNKHNAAKFLGVSERTVAAYAAGGRLSVRYVKGKTRDVADYDEEELARLKELPLGGIMNREGANLEEQGGNKETGIAVQQRAANPETVQNAVSMFLLTEEQFAALSSKPDVTLADKTLLTLAEAAQFCGIAQKRLRDAATAGELKARKIGRASRVRRTDLDAWIDAQFE